MNISGMLGYWWVWIIFFITYYILEFIISLFFNYKISMITKDKFGWAAFHGGTATFLFMFGTLIAAFISAAATEATITTRILFLLWTTLGTTIGNVTSTILMPVINKKIDSHKAKKENLGEN